MGRWDPEKKRHNYGKLRLQDLRKQCPELAVNLGDDSLSRSSLRQLSKAVRRAGRNQSSLPQIGSQGQQQPAGCSEAPCVSTVTATNTATVTATAAATAARSLSPIPT